MISYDNYKNRIEKLAKAKRIVHKFRFLICGVLALLIGVSVGLMCAKGSYTSGMTLSAQTVYFNDPYEVTAAKAFLASSSEQRVEYRLSDGGEWSAEKPVKAGKYQARTVTKKLAGYNYSPSVEFEILPVAAEFTIRGDSVVYGENPLYHMTNLVSGHRVDESALEFEYADYAAASTEVKAVKVKIVDGSGDDFSDCYDVTVVPKTLEITKRRLSATPETYEFTYDGAVHASLNEMSSGTLAYLAKGDTLTVTTGVYSGETRLEDGAVNAGTYTVKVESLTVMHGETDVTAHYNIDEITSQLTVLRRAASFNLEGGSKVYDGTALTSGKLTGENLVEGHNAVVAGRLPSITNVGMQSVRYSVNIFDGDGNDVTRNYAQKCTAGELRILPCEINYSTKDKEWTYDGETHSNLEFELENELAGFTFAAYSLGAESEITDFGTKDNKIGLRVYNGDEVDVTSNFTLTQTACGTLKINKRAITVTTGGLNGVYNGAEQYSYDGEVTGGTLVGGHYIQPSELVTITDAGTKPNETVFEVYDNGSSVTHNYEIGYVYGTFTIEPRHITVTTNDAVREYDGTPLSDGGYTTDIEGGGLFNGDKLDLVGNAVEITQKGSVPNSNNYTVPSANYVIDDTVYGTLTVLPKNVAVTINGSTSVYGEAIPDNGFTLDCGELPNGETLGFTTRYERGGATYAPAEWEGYTLLDAGVYDIAPDSSLVISGGNASLDNYIINVSPGTLTVTARRIIVTTATDEKVYDGKPLQNDGYTTVWENDITRAGLLNGDELIKDTNNTVVNPPVAGPYPNVCNYKVPNGNYEIADTVYGTLTITPRPVIVYTGSTTKTYDGLPLTNEEYTVKYAVEVNGDWVADETKDGLVEQDGVKDTFTLIGTPVTITNAYEVDNTNRYENSNYDIKEYIDGTLKIEKFKVNIGLTHDGNSYSGIYFDGIYYGYTNPITDHGTSFFVKDGQLVLGEDVLVNGERLDVRYKFKQNGDYVEYKNAGTYVTEAYKFEVRGADGMLIEGGENNYDITCDDGINIIRPRKVTVNIENKTAVYGDELPANSVNYVAEHYVNGNIAVEKLSFDEILIPDYVYDPADPADPGVYDITATACKVYDENGALIEDGYKNYEIKYVGGTLTIEQRALYIATGSASKTYDGKPLSKPNPSYYSLNAGGQHIEGLASGHKLVPTFVREVTNATVDEEGNVVPVANDTRYKIVDGGGNEVTDRYAITYLPDGTLTVERAGLSLYLYNDLHYEDIYYGDKWSYPTGAGNYRSARGLVNNEQLEVAVTIYSEDLAATVESPKNVGRYSVRLDKENSVVYTADGTPIPNGLNNYQFDILLSGKLEVNKKAVEVTFENCSLVYGESAEGKTYTYIITIGLDGDGKLPYGESFEIGSYTYYNGEEEAPEKKNAGEYDIKGNDLVFKDKDGVEIDGGEKNYSVTYAGKLTVTKKKVNINLIYGETVYGSEGKLQAVAKFGEDFEPGGGADEPVLAYDEVLWVIVGYKKDGVAVERPAHSFWRLNAGDYTRYAREYVIKESEEATGYCDRGLTLKNYEITCGEGDFKVTPYAVEIALRNREITYGETLSFTSPLFAEDYEFPYGDVFSVEHLIDGETASATKIYGAGDHSISMSEWSVTHNGDEVPNKNYNITWVPGTLTVGKRQIKVKPADVSRTYGQSIPAEGGKFTLYEGEKVITELYNGDTLQIGAFAYLKDGAVPDRYNAGTYTITVTQFIITDASGAVERGDGTTFTNYEVAGLEGTLTVSRKNIHIKLKDVENVYYGHTFYYPSGIDNWEIPEKPSAATELANGEKLKVAVHFARYQSDDEYISAPTKVGGYIYSVDETNSKVYESNGTTLIDGGIANYVITYSAKWRIDILPLTITVSPLEFTKEKGNALQYGDLETYKYPDYIGNYSSIVSDGVEIVALPYGEQFKISSVYFSYKDENKFGETLKDGVGLHKIRTYGYGIYDKDGNFIDEGYDNYIVRKGESTFEIVPRKLSVQLNSYTLEYGEFAIGGYGTFAYPDNAGNYDFANSDPTVYSEKIKVLVKYRQKVDGILQDVSPKDAGTYAIVGTDYVLYSGDGRPDKENYDITFVPGELVITQKIINVEISKEHKITYGTPVPAIVVAPVELAYGDTFAATYLYYTDEKYDVMPRNADAYGITVRTAKINGIDIALRSDGGNYYVDVTDGELLIEKAKITVTLNDLPDVVYGAPVEYTDDYVSVVGMQYGETPDIAVYFTKIGDTQPTEPKNKGDYEIHLDLVNTTVNAEDEEARVLTRNYTVIHNVASVTVEPRAVNVVFDGQEHDYGEALDEVTYKFKVNVDDITDGSLTEDALPNGETFTVAAWFLPDGDEGKEHIASPRNANVYRIDAQSVTVTGGEGNADNYAFTFGNDSWLYIWEKTIRIEMDNMQSTYGDFYVSVPETHTFGFNETFGGTEYGDVFTVNSIKFTSLDSEDEITPKNKGDYHVYAESVTVTYWDGRTETLERDGHNRCIFENYYVFFNYGTLTIDPREVTVDIDDDLSAVYGGELPEVTAKFISDGEEYALPYGDGIEFTCHYEDGEGNVYNTDNLPENKGAYFVFVDTVTVKSDLSENYVVGKERGLLTIGGRPITVVVHGDKSTYGYTALPEFGFDIYDDEDNEYTLPYGDKLVPAYTFHLNGAWSDMPKNAGVYDIVVDETKCSIEGGNGDYSNYLVTYEPDGKFTVEQMALTVTISHASKIYGDEMPEIPTTVTSGGVACTRLPNNDVLKLDFTFASEETGYNGAEPEVAGEYLITATADIEGGQARIENYAITYASADPEKAATLTIEQREIEITLNIGGNLAFTYGTEFDSVICTAKVTGAVDGQAVNVAVTYRPYEQPAARAFAMRARALSARAADGFMPKNAGKYVASLSLANCTVTDASGAVAGGISNYKLKDGFTCAEVVFEITPMELTVTVENPTAVYGDALPGVKYSVAETMPEGESLELTFSYTGTPKHVGTYAVNIDSKAIDGGIISNYNLNYTNAAPALSITPRPLTVRLSDMDEAFNTEYSYATEAADNYDIANSDKLAYEDKLRVTEVKFIDGLGNEIDRLADVGTYYIALVDYEILSVDGENVKGDYAQVVGNYGELTIIGNVIVIHTGSAEREYTGSALTCTDYTLDGTLPDGYSVVPDGEPFGVTNVTAEGGVDNTTAFKIVGSDGKKTKNYILSYGDDGKTYGKLIVTPKNVKATVVAVSPEYEYGDTPEFTCTTDVALADGEELTFEVGYGENTPLISGGFFLLNVGNYRAYYKEGSAAISGGNGKIENYNVTFEEGGAPFKVVARQIAVTAPTPAAHEYDGNEFYNYADYKTKRYVNGAVTDEAGLIGTDELEVVSYTKVTDVTDGTENVCRYSAPANYAIAHNENGTLVVTKRAITIKTADINEEYDGQPHSDGTLTYDESRLVSGHRVEVVGDLVEQTECITGGVNRLQFVIKDAENNDVTANYAVTPDYGEINITRRVITIKTGSVDSVYNGLEQGNAKEESVDRLLAGHKLKLLKEFTYTNATEGVNNTTTYTVEAADGSDVTEYYKINYTYGKIKIAKAPVTVTLKPGVVAQYGDDYARLLSVGAVTLVNGETADLAISFDTEVNSVGTYRATVDWGASEVYNSDNRIIRNGTANYEVVLSPEWREFEVVARELTITLNADGKTSFTYGSDYNTDICTVTTDYTEQGVSFKATVKYSQNGVECVPEDVGEYTAEFIGLTVEGGNPDNYTVVSHNTVTFSIVRKNLDVSMDDLTVPYGAALVYPEGVSGYKTVIGLVSGHTLVSVTPKFEKNGSPVAPDFADEYDILCGGITVTDADGNAVNSENYNINTLLPYGTLTIEGVGLSIIRKTVTKTYDGNVLDLSDYAIEEQISYVIDGVENGALTAGHEIRLDGGFTSDSADAGSTPNTATYKVVDASGATVGSYAITHVANGAELVIEQRPISVTSNDADRPYNGLPLTADFTYDPAELVSGHTISYANPASITDRGTKPNTMDIVIKDAGGNTVTGNYDIDFTAGTLSISALSVNIAVEDMIKVYGEDINVNNFELTGALVNGETLSFRVLRYTGGGNTYDGSTPLDVGMYTIVANSVSGMSVTKADGASGNVSNYIITFADGATLTVTERHIVVTTPTPAAHEYDGNVFYNYDDYTTKWYVNGAVKDEAGLIGTDRLEMLTYTDVTDVTDGKENVCTYSAPANYIIEDYVNGKLIVTGRTISVSSNDVHETYDGQLHSDSTPVYDSGKLLAGHTITVIDYTEQRDATKGVENALQYKITNALGGDETPNYTFKPDFGTIVIDKAPLTVKLNNGGTTSFGYGDGTFDGQFKNFTTEGLVTGETLTVALVYNTADGKVPKNAGTYKVELDKVNSSVAYAGEGKGIDNYEITCAAVDFEITRKKITVSLGEWTAEEYNGGTHTYDRNKLIIPDGALVSGETVSRSSVVVRYSSSKTEFVNAGTPSDAGTYYVFLDLDETRVRGADNRINAISVNYDVDCDSIEFEVLPKKLVITISDVSHVYDGNEFEFTESDGFSANTCGSDKVACNVTYSATPVNVGTYTITVDPNIVFTSGKASNYEYDEAQPATCTLTIKERAITVRVADRNEETGYGEYTKAHLTSYTADGKAGFVAGDLDKFDEVQFIKTDKSDAPAGAIEYKSVTVNFVGDVKKNYTITVISGTLTVTKRKVLVKPLVNEKLPLVYDGEAVDIGFTHVHNIPNAAENDKLGFLNNDEDLLTATYYYKDAAGKESAGLPVNAGTYTVSVTLTGSAKDDYYVTYQSLTITIQKRPLTFNVQVTGAGTYEYSNSRPEDLDIQVTDCAGFVNGVPDDIVPALYDENGKVATRYNVGKYTVGIDFEGVENYKMPETTAKIEITPRTLIVVPTDPYNGEKQTYNGTKLALGSGNREIVYGELADGDKLTVTSNKFAPTALRGYLEIAEVIITGDDGTNARDNYTVYYKYDVNNTLINSEGLSSDSFRVRVEFVQTKIVYRLSGFRTVYDYTGSKRTHTFGSDAKIELVDGYTLDHGHYLAMSRPSVQVGADAGDYDDLIMKYVAVYEGKTDVTAIYNLECINPEEAVITVKKNVLNVVLDEDETANLQSGLQEKAVVSGLYASATPAHKAEVYAFNVDGEWIIGVIVFSETGTKRRDLSVNYELDAATAASGVTLLTLEKADEYSRPALSVEIQVKAAQLAAGRGSLFKADGEGRWVLDESCYDFDETLLFDGHTLQVVVYVGDDGSYCLAVTVFEQLANRRKDATESYRLKDVVTTDVAAGFVTVSAESALRRELYIDFSGVSIADGVASGYKCYGLNTADGHAVEVTAEEKTGGGYTLTVVIYQNKRVGTKYKKVDKSSSYKIIYDKEPSGITAVTGTV